MAEGGSLRDRVETVYRATQHWPHEEVYGLTTQARRAATADRCAIAAMLAGTETAARRA
jgi:four helix bundle protein